MTDRSFIYQNRRVFSTEERRTDVTAYKIDDALNITSSKVNLANSDVLECNQTSIELPYNDAIRLRNYLNKAYPLKPLVWTRVDTEKLAGIYCEKTDSYIEDAVSFCSTLVAEYVIRQDKETGRYRTNYGGRTENPYDTIAEAERWAEFTHYPSQMQPYVLTIDEIKKELTQ